MSEWYKAVRIEVLVGIRRTDLDPVLTAAQAPDSVFTAVGKATALEPLHVGLIDQGYNATNTPAVCFLDAQTVQIDAGLNEIPNAVCELATGRDATAMATGTSSSDAVSITHVIERYIGRFIPVRIYARATVTAAAGTPDGEVGDFFNDPAEWVVLFDGLSNGTTRRGTPAAYRLVLHLTHFTAVLEFSSSLASVVAAGTNAPYALSAALYRSPAAPLASGFGPFTSLGYVASGLVGGTALATDFWGYDVTVQGGGAQGGLRRFLLDLASQDLFDWQSFARIDLGGSVCPDYGRRANNKAIAAIARIEPFNNGPPPVADWNSIRAAVTASGTDRAVDRSTLIRLTRASGSYANVGYRYGVPISFYLNKTALGPFDPATAFAGDVAFATLNELAPASFWELLASRYAGRYQIAIAPMADRAVVIPFQPLLDGSWQTVYASEVFSWDDDVRDQAPVRGVVLVSRRRSDSGWITSGVQDAAAQSALATADAAFDSCEDGVFVYRAMPPWLANANRRPEVWGTQSVLGTRVKSAVPARTAILAAAQVVGTLTSATGVTTAAAAYAAAGLPEGAPTAPSTYARSTANRMAKALYQQTRTGPHSVYVRGRFRYDIGPGSVISLELPGDRYVKAALVGNRDTRMSGMVLRTSILIDRERMSASTSLQVGFARTEAETRPGHVLFATGHPFWATAVYGVPWSDAVWIRNRLGNNADINFRVPGV